MFRELQDANAYGIILDAQFEELGRRCCSLVEGADARAKVELSSQMAGIDYARRANNEDLRHLLLAVRERARARDYATSWLSSLKWKFLQMEMSPLVAYADELYAHVMGKSGMLLSFSSPVIFGFVYGDFLLGWSEARVDGWLMCGV